jgi:8-oxo-dGTP pyrophosphatase MutT (NUDIX family)
MPVVATNRPHLIVAGLLIRDDLALLCHRSASKEWYPGVWDFPGGHVEAHETPPAALVRELREELSIEISEPVGDCLNRRCNAEFDMRVWLITEWIGTLENAAPDEHDRLGWFSGSEVDALKLADESYPALITAALLQVHDR